MPGSYRGRAGTLDTMARLCVAFALLAGCDGVFGLKGVPDAAPQPIVHDEDGDGIDDAVDGCPTIVDVNDQLDSDGDGIGDPCDLGPDADAATLVTFAGGADDRVAIDGVFVAGDDDLQLGNAQPGEIQTAFLALAPVDTARFDVGFRMTAPTDAGPNFHEVAVATVNLDTTHDGRGDICYAGFDATSAYIEVDEDAGRYQLTRFPDVALVDHEAVLSIVRTPSAMICTLKVDGVWGGQMRLDPVEISRVGRVGVWTNGSIASLHYLWYVTPRP